MKKLFALTLVLMLALSLAACGNHPAPSSAPEMAAGAYERLPEPSKAPEEPTSTTEATSPPISA